MAFETTPELAQFVEKELGHDISTAVSSQRDDIIQQLDTAHKTIIGGGGMLNFDSNGVRLREDITFLFAKSKFPRNTTIYSGINTGTVHCHAGSVTLVFDVEPDTFGVSVTTGLTDWFIRINGDRRVHRILSHTPGELTATMASYAHETFAAAPFELYHIITNVGTSSVEPKILTILNPLRIDSDDVGHTIKLVDPEELHAQYPLGQISEGIPKMAAIIKEVDGMYSFQWSHYLPFGAASEHVEFDYIEQPNTLSEVVDPILPRQFRIILAYVALYNFMVRNDDDRAAAHLQMARDKFSELAQWNERIMSSGDPDYGRIVLSGFSASRTLNFTKIT